jgi:hypothetical protein
MNGTVDRRAMAAALCAATLLLSGAALCQEEAAAAGSVEPGADIAAKLAEMEARLESQQAEIEAQREQIRALQEEGAAGGEEATTEESLELEGASVETGDLLDVYGFFDLGFYKAFLEEDSSYNMFLNDASTFVITNLNLYLASQMTESLGALVELRFSFLPTGQEETTGQVIHVGDTEIQVAEYQRLDTTVWDSSTVMEFRQGGLSIERVHLTYEPLDWLGFLAGRFLTPYGIWNVDHGSPVILTARTPYMLTRRMVPSAQTGVQVYGRFYPRYDLFFDYAITLSNGRGPMDEVMDLDDNKAVGLRMRLSYEGDDVNIAAGGYGYLGSYTDITKTAHLMMTTDANGDMVLDESADQPMSVQVERDWAFMEYAVSADLLMEFWGVGLQSEFVWHYVDVEVPGVRATETNLFTGAPADLLLYTPSSVGYGVYSLLYWRLPLDRWIRPVKLTPYVMYEYNSADDTTPYTNFQFLLAGLNVKPSPFVTFKGEYFRAIPESEFYGDDLQGIYFQMAVTF